MANTISRYTGSDPRGETSVMSKIVVTDAKHLGLADMPSADTYTLRLWAKAGAARSLICYIGGSAFTMAVTTAWKEFKFSTTTTSAGTCEIYLPTGTYYIWHPMLERSSKASDYRQAPEDVENEIDAAENNAINTSKDYTDGRLVGYATSTEVSTQIEQTKSEINISVAEKVVETKTYAVEQATQKADAAKDAANAATDTKLQSYATITQMNSAIEAKASEINLSVSRTYATITYTDTAAGNARTGAGRDTDSKLANYSTTEQMNSAINLKANAIISSVSETYATKTTTNGLSTRLSTAESKITQQGNSISSLVTTTDNLSGRMTTAESSITQNADAIALRVTKSGLVSEINQSSGTIAMKSNRFTIDSTYFKLSANGTVTASNLTLTGGTIKSSNYSAGSAGMKINLSTGAITAANFSMTSAGKITATSATLNSATITGTLKTSSSDNKFFTTMDAGQLQIYYNSKRVAYMLPLFNVDDDICQLCIIGSGNYDGIAIGAAFGNESGSSDFYTYYRCNIQNAYSVEDCRHHFIGTVKFDDRFKSNVNFDNHIGVAWGGNIGMRYTTPSASGVARTGLWVGIGDTNTCLTGTAIYAEAPFYMGAHHINLNLGYGLVYDGTMGLCYYNGTAYKDPNGNAVKGMFIGHSGHTTMIAGSDAQCFVQFKAWNGIVARTGITAQDCYIDLANSYGIRCNSKIAFRYYSSAIYCGIDTAPLRLVGSAIYANGSPVATTSDARFKEDIRPLDDRYVDMLDEIEPVSFKYKDSGSHRTHTGFTAQNVLEAIESAGLTTQDVAAFVDVSGEGKEYALRYEELIAVLLLKVRKLEDRIKNMEVLK